MKSALTFWIIATLPGLLHPILLWIYFLRFRERKDLIKVLLDRSVSGSTLYLSERQRQKDEWNNKLDLNLPSFLAPVIITSFISIAGIVVILNKHFGGINILRLPEALFVYTLKVPSAAASAGFAGAYVWGLYDFVDRFRILSLPPSALHMIWFRLVLGSVLGEFTQQLLAAKDFAPVLAFALASLPIPSLLKWMQDFASQKFAIGGPATPQPPKWEWVQGLTPDIIDRLYEAGVTSAAHLGNQDPIRLLRGTNIAWRNILDMMDQAYLAAYVGDGIDKLRCKGIRGSIEMAIIWQRLHNSKTSADAAALITSIASDVCKDEVSVRNLAQNLWEDPQVDRIWSLWWDRDVDRKPRPDASDGTPEPGERDPAQSDEKKGGLESGTA